MKNLPLIIFQSKRTDTWMSLSFQYPSDNINCTTCRRRQLDEKNAYQILEVYAINAPSLYCYTTFFYPKIKTHLLSFSLFEEFFRYFLFFQVVFYIKGRKFKKCITDMQCVFT